MNEYVFIYLDGEITAVVKAETYLHALHKLRKCIERGIFCDEIEMSINVGKLFLNYFEPLIEDEEEKKLKWRDLRFRGG